MCYSMGYSWLPPINFLCPINLILFAEEDMPTTSSEGYTCGSDLGNAPWGSFLQQVVSHR